MKSNSNFNITKSVVDPVSQEITDVWINGEKFSSEEPGPSEEYETWYVGLAGGEYFPIAVNGNPYDEHPNITHYALPYNPNDKGDEMNWKKYEAYDVEVDTADCGGMQINFYLDIGKTQYVTIFSNQQEGAMAKIYIKSSDITDA